MESRKRSKDDMRIPILHVSLTWFIYSSIIDRLPQITTKYFPNCLHIFGVIDTLPEKIQSKIYKI